jgi:mannose-1-phosphate guanylyltransferase
MKFVIRAGGIGTRLWPYSRASKPKQFHDLAGSGKTMLQDAVGRIAPIAGKEDIFVSTGAALEPLVREQLPDLQADQLIIEPALRNTGPAVGLECALLETRFPGCTIASLGSDHHIGKADEFCRLLSAAEKAAETHPDYLFTIGVKPTRAETGYGYIRKGALLCEAEGEPVHEASEFTEKPDEALAQQYVDGGEYLWNSNMFVWKAKTVLDLFAEFQPGIHEGLMRIAAATAGTGVRAVIDKEYPSLAAIAVDNAILEPASKVATLEGDLDWGDIGSWAALTDVMDTDGDGNLLNGEVVCLDAKGVTAYAQAGRLIALVGVEDLVVVDTKDALLICRKDQAQRAREIVDRLQAEERLKRYS